MTLTNKQRAFVEHYLAIGEFQWNATEAAARAGYKGNRVTLARVGSENVRNPKIARLIRARLEEMGANTEALVRRWLMRSGVDISPYVTKDGLDLVKLKRAGLGFLIKGVVKTGRDGHINIVLRDPDVAEDRLAKALGVYVERHEITGKDRGPIERKEVGDLTGLTEEELDRLEQIARRLQGD